MEYKEIWGVFPPLNHGIVSIF